MPTSPPLLAGEGYIALGGTASGPALWGGDPMLKLIYCLRRKPELTVEGFQR